MGEFRRPAYSEAAKQQVAKFQPGIVGEVQGAVDRDAVVVVGMGWNPHVKKARTKLEEMKVPFTYLQYGNYIVGWRQRLALKIWAGWPTFPMVFVNGSLVGGNTDLRKAVDEGTFKTLLDAGRSA